MNQPNLIPIYPLYTLYTFSTVLKQVYKKSKKILRSQQKRTRYPEVRSDIFIINTKVKPHNCYFYSKN